MNLQQAHNKLARFLDLGELCGLIMSEFCGRCKASEQDTVETPACDNCKATDWECEVEGIIINEGIEYMKQLTIEWKKGNRES